jgi:hypothetical protein
MLEDITLSIYNTMFIFILVSTEYCLVLPIIKSITCPGLTQLAESTQGLFRFFTANHIFNEFFPIVHCDSSQKAINFFSELPFDVNSPDNENIPVNLYAFGQLPFDVNSPDNENIPVNLNAFDQPSFGDNNQDNVGMNIRDNQSEYTQTTSSNDRSSNNDPFYYDRARIHDYDILSYNDTFLH